MSSQKCFYHPTIDAVDKCSRCNKLLCLQDKKVSYPYGYSKDTYNPAIPMVYCPECYENIFVQGRIKFNRMNRFSIIMFVITAGVFLIVFGSMFFNFMNVQNNNSPFPGLPTQNSFNMFTFIMLLIIGIVIIILIGTFTMAFKYFSRSKNRMNQEPNRTHNETEYFTTSTTNNPKSSLDNQFCRFCGTKLNNTEINCPRCGAKI